MRHLLLLFFLPLVASLGAQRYAQRLGGDVVIGDSSQLHEVVLIDYAKFLGTVTYFMADSLRLKLPSVAEPVVFPASFVRSVSVKYPESDGVPAPRRNLPFTDLTLLRTALPYHGRQQLKTVMLLYNVVEWNLNDHVQLGVGAAGPFVFLFNQRYRTSLTPWLHVGLSNETIVPVFLQIFSESVSFLGDLTTLTTVGSDEQYFSFGAGIFYRAASNRKPTRNYRVGAGTQVSPRVHLYGELLAFIDPFEETGVLPTLNVSVAGKDHRWYFGVLGVVTDFNGSLVAPLPYVGYSASLY